MRYPDVELERVLDGLLDCNQVVFWVCLRLRVIVVVVIIVLIFIWLVLKQVKILTFFIILTRIVNLLVNIYELNKIYRYNVNQQIQEIIDEF